MYRDKRKLVIGIIYYVWHYYVFEHISKKYNNIRCSYYLKLEQLLQKRIIPQKFKLPTVFYGLAMIICLVLCVLVFVFKLYKINKVILALNILTITTLVLGMQGINFIIVTIEGILSRPNALR